METCKVCDEQYAEWFKKVEDEMPQSVCKRCDTFTDKTNRAFHQTKLLLKLVNNDWEKLKELEMQLKNCFCFYCPADVEEVEKVMKLVPNSAHFNFG